MSLASLLFACLVLGVLPVASAECDDTTAIWATAEDDGVRHLLYGTSSITMWSGIFIEEWRSGKRAWRTKAAWATCSNGEVTCSVQFSDETSSDGGASAVIERIDEDRDGLAEWIVLAGLREELYYGGGAAVEWDEGFRPEDDDGMSERAVPSSNAFKFFACRKDPVAMDKTTLFGADEVCHKYRESGSLEPDPTFPSAPDAIWWMTGSVIKGAEFNCSVASFGKDGTITATCRKNPAEESKVTRIPLSYEGEYVVVAGQRLDMCVH